MYTPKNDWDISNNTNALSLNNTGTTGTNHRGYANRWRPAYWGGDESTPYNDQTASNKKDWSVSFADLYAYDDRVHMVWYSLIDNKTYYRGLKNGQTNSGKFPPNSGNAVDLGISGESFPAITVDAGGKPVIVAYDDGAKQLKVFQGNQIEATSFTTTVVEGGTFGYPKISSLESGGNFHLFYHDRTNSTLKYCYATTSAGLASATKVVLDEDAVPGKYIDIRMMNGNKPVVTYLAEGYINTPDALRTCRYVGSGTGAADYQNKSNWEIVTLPCANVITDNKVRGYYCGSGATAWLYGFAKSDRPEFFREKR